MVQTIRKVKKGSRGVVGLLDNDNENETLLNAQCCITQSFHYHLCLIPLNDSKKSYEVPSCACSRCPETPIENVISIMRGIFSFCIRIP